MNLKIPVSWIVLLLLSIACTKQNKVVEPWETLFNGTDMTGWKIIGDKGNVWIEDSAFVAHCIFDTLQHTFICTEEKYDDYIFEAEARVQGPLHTGFIIRASEVPINNGSNTTLSGYQVKIDPTERRWTGGIFDEVNGVTWYYPLTGHEKAQAAFKYGEWNKYRIEAIGDSIKIWVNGTPTCNLVHSKYNKGYIAIKVHWLRIAEEEKYLMRYKNMRIITKDPEKYKKPMDYPVIDLMAI